MVDITLDGKLASYFAEENLGCKLIADQKITVSQGYRSLDQYLYSSIKDDIGYCKWGLIIGNFTVQGSNWY